MTPTPDSRVPSRVPAEPASRFLYKGSHRTALLALPYDTRWNDPYRSR
ncbi:hypothetical protein ACFWN1_02605 [Streptomyces sp. NPDC058459]